MYRMQIASDIIRDGLGLELLKDELGVVEVFRCDADKAVMVAVHEAVPLREVEALSPG